MHIKENTLNWLFKIIIFISILFVIGVIIKKLHICKLNKLNNRDNNLLFTFTKHFILNSLLLGLNIVLT